MKIDRDPESGIHDSGLYVRHDDGAMACHVHTKRKLRKHEKPDDPASPIVTVIESLAKDDWLIDWTARPVTFKALRALVAELDAEQP